MDHASMSESEVMIRPLLGSDERLLWSGRPRQGIVFGRSDLFAIPFSLFFFGFSVFWIVGAATQTKGTSWFPLFGVPFVLIGLYMLVGRHLADSYYRSGLYYGLTDQRAILASTVFGRKVTSIDLKGLTGLKLEQSSPSIGTVQLAHPTTQANTYGEGGFSNWGQGAMGPTPCFFEIEDSKRVYDLARSVAAGKS
jgi:hypothetical protein